MGTDQDKRVDKDNAMLNTRGLFISVILLILLGTSFYFMLPGGKTTQTEPEEVINMERLFVPIELGHFKIILEKVYQLESNKILSMKDNSFSNKEVVLSCKSASEKEAFRELMYGKLVSREFIEMQTEKTKNFVYEEDENRIVFKLNCSNKYSDKKNYYVLVPVFLMRGIMTAYHRYEDIYVKK